MLVWISGAVLVAFLSGAHFGHWCNRKEREALRTALRSAQCRILLAREMIFRDWLKATDVLGMAERDAARALRTKREDVVLYLSPAPVKQLERQLKATISRSVA